MSNAPISPEQLLQQLNWRYATKKFDPTQQIPDDIWHALEQSLVLSPSSFGLQPWKFFVVQDPDIRKQLLEHSWNQTQVIDASHLVVFAIKKDVDAAYVDRYMERTAEVRQTSLESLEGFANVIKGFMAQPPYPLDLNAWSTRQAYIAMSFYMTSAALLGIDTCPMEGINPAKYDEILGLAEQGYATVAACPAGYRAEGDRHADLAKVRFKTEDVVQYI